MTATDGLILLLEPSGQVLGLTTLEDARQRAIERALSLVAVAPDRELPIWALSAELGADGRLPPEA